MVNASEKEYYLLKRIEHILYIVKGRTDESPVNTLSSFDFPEQQRKTVVAGRDVYADVPLMHAPAPFTRCAFLL
jgi:hypothetical protein